jgi:hypothetical protein
MTGHLFLNKTLLSQVVLGPGIRGLDAPLIGFVPLGATDALAVMEHIAANHTQQDDPLVRGMATRLPATQYYTYGFEHYIHFTASKTVKVNGDELLAYQYDNGRDVPMTDSLAQNLFAEWYLYLNETGVEADRLEAERLLELAESVFFDPNTDVQYLVNRMCFLPANFVVQVITESPTYGVAAFFSDLGGYISLLTTVVVFLFPLVFQPTEPRTFLPLWMQAKWRARKERKEELKVAEAAQAAKEERKRAREMTAAAVTPSQQQI